MTFHAIHLFYRVTKICDFACYDGYLPRYTSMCLGSDRTLLLCNLLNDALHSVNTVAGSFLQATSWG